jgi:ATP-dependent DNA helicase RecG
VEQRAQLREAGLAPHYLVMTATPIPRTLAMTLFGDLDVSTIRESPPGRQAIHTYLGSDERREKWWDFFRTKLRTGRQGYVITPLVDESDQIEVRSVEAAFEALANGELEEFRLDLVHGRMGGEAKAAVMDRFRSGEIQVLVATSVVEVGVDVPNATLMTIEGGERFGLAQLHQLRGRVSRGRHPGYVCVFADPQTDEAKRRLEAFAETNDGFQLADIDFQLRGPGDLLGTRQHGLPPMRIADLRRDGEMLARARNDARKLVADDPELSNATWERLKRQVLRRYGDALDLGDVG